MLQSILVYGFLALSLSVLGRVAYTRQKIRPVGYATPSFLGWEIVAALFLFSLVSGLRWQVGVDHLNYLSAYIDATNGVYAGISGLEPGFFYLTKLFADLDVHFFFYFGFIALLQIYFFYRSFNSERYLFPFLGALVILGSQYLDWMNGMRQALAATIFVYSTKFIFERRLFSYIVAIVCASLFHKSALVLIPFYFIGRVDLFRNRVFTLSLLVSCILVGNSSAWISESDLVGDLLMRLGYEGYSSNFEYLVSEYQQQTAFGPRRLSVTFLWVVLIYYSVQLKAYHKGTRIIVFYNLGILGALYYNLFASAGHIILRPLYYFAIFLPILVAYLLSMLRSTRDANNFDFRSALIFTLASAFLFISIAAEISGESPQYSTYKFFWEY